jgi:Tol biopolymer transport system component/tRNA A-37 threonylcarbamoyl transferase component Bud32
VALPHDDWLRLKEVFAGARALPRERRPAYLAEACGDNEALRQEVESLLTSNERAKSFLETPAAAQVQDAFAAVNLEGQRIGSYQIEARIGAGGMGEVYRARDTKLNRHVAIKVLLPAVANDPDRLARFSREAQLLAALNHPHIAQIHGLEDAGDLHALVMELVEGPTLADRIARGPIPIDEALSMATQIAEALEAAHEQGIIHRDLKPANIKVREDGMVKVLDFGLAKALDAIGAAAEDAMTSPGPGLRATEAGVILGTAAYMSPEQARGRPVDRRTDIWAFGCVLYESLTGRPAFAGKTMSDLLAAVLTTEPDWTTLPEETPAPIRKLLRRCLEKDRKRRLDSAADARLEIDDVLAALPGEASVVTRPRPTWQKWAIAAAMLIVLIVSAAAAVRLGRQPAAYPMHFAIPVIGEVSQLALSSDGRLLAFVAPDETTGKNILSVQAIGQPQATPLAGTEGASYPFWSPDAAYVGFFANGNLMKVRSSGGPAQTIVAVTRSARGASWGSKNVIVYSRIAGGPLWRVNADGSGASVLTDALLTPDERSHRWPMFLPDGDRFLFWAGDFSKENARSGIYLSSLSERQKAFLVEARSNVGFAQNGYLFYVDEKGGLAMQAFDPDAGHVTGDIRLIAGAVGFQPSLYWGAFAVSASGTVVVNPASALSQSVLTWYDRGGKELGIVGRPAMMYNPSLSPDGQQLAADISDPIASNVDVWTFDLRAGTSGRFTFGVLEEATPVWAPDGSRIAYSTTDSGAEVKLTTGLEKGRIIAERPAATIYTGGNLVLPNSWSRNGEYVVTTNSGNGQEPSYLALFKIGDQKPVQVLAGKGNQINGQISPDGKWLAYASDESGGWNIYATTFPSAAGKWQVSVGGGTEPRWRGDGKEMFYLDAKGMLTAVSISAGSTFSSGTPEPLFRVRPRPPISNTDLFSYDVSKDGSRFIVNRYVKPSSVPPLDILLNATAAVAESRD